MSQSERSPEPTNARDLDAMLTGARKAQEVLDAGGSQEEATEAFKKARAARWQKSFLMGLGIPAENLGYLDEDGADA